MKRPSRGTSAWILCGGALGLVTALLNAVAAGNVAIGLFGLLFSIWLVITGLVVVRWVWRKLTYRVSVRLFLSYLLIGVTPFFFCAAFGGLALYLFAGQYTSVRFGSEMEHHFRELDSRCRAALDAASEGELEAAVEVLHELENAPPAPLQRVLWMTRVGGRVQHSTGAEGLPFPAWVGGEERKRAVIHDGEVFALTRSASGPDMAVVLVPLDKDLAVALNAEQWFDALFMVVQGEESDGVNISVGPSGPGGDVRFNQNQVRMADVWKAWPEAETVWDRPFLIWFRIAESPIDLATGQPVDGLRAVTLLRTSPANAWHDFVLSRYQLGIELKGALIALATVFLVVYAVAAVIAGGMILSITRSTGRLTRGASAVGRGELDHRIKVKRRDQLGDLAAAFNGMTEAVQSMLADVAEKERLAHELELAREIQESLLPDRHLRHGSLSIHATFRPAAEVGGDYFDIFPLGEDRLVLAAGDVAGHGLSTGLLMAALKSLVAALVHEGYAGTELLTRVNRLLREQGTGRTMVTLAVLDVDLRRDQAVLTNAGHPPVWILTPDGEVEEVVVGSLPLGSKLCQPAERTLQLPPGARMVLCSDGLVEAADPRGEPFGYEALAELLRSNANALGDQLVVRLTEAVDGHAQGRPLADDLTVLVLDRAVGEEGVE